MSWDKRIQMLFKIQEVEQEIIRVEQELNEIHNYQKEFKDIHEKYDELYGKRYGFNHKHLKRRLEGAELKRMMHLSRAESSQPHRLVLGFGGLKKIEYDQLTDKLNLIHSNLSGMEEEWQNYLRAQLDELADWFDEYDKEYRRYSVRFNECRLMSKYQPMERFVYENIWLGELFFKLSSIPDIREMVEKGNYLFCDKGEIRLLFDFDINIPNIYVIWYSSRLVDEIHSWIRNIFRQVLCNIPMYQYEFYYMDGLYNGKGLRELLGLQGIINTHMNNVISQLNEKGFQILHISRNDESIQLDLEYLDRYMGIITDLLKGQSSIVEYNNRNDEKIPYCFVIIDGIERCLENQLIKKLLMNGPSCGIFVVLLLDIESQSEGASRQMEHEKYLKSLPVDSFRIYYSIDAQMKEQIRVEYKLGKSAKAILFCGQTDSSKLIDSIIENASVAGLIDNNFDSCFPEEYPYGQYQSTTINGKGGAKGGIRIPFAISEHGEIVDIEIGSAQYAHGLISGNTGSGKSTLLHMLINSVVMNYHPSDVEIWLVDYKKIEMSVYIKNRPPHIKFIGLERNEEFTFCFLDKIDEEFKRRLKLLSEVRTIDNYKMKFGITSLSRILIIIDEFHLMSQQVRESEKYARKLENLLAEGRSAGIVCLFADQSISVGLNGLTEKGKNQMKLRLAMANNREEMKVALDVSSIAEADVALQTGEVRIKRDIRQKKADGTTETVSYLDLNKVIFLSDDCREKVADKARSIYGTGKEAIIVDGSKEEYIDWEAARQYEKEADERGEAYFLHLGKPSSFEKCFAVILKRNNGNNVICIHENYELQRRILLSTINSFLCHENRRLYILADDNDGLYCRIRKELCELCKKFENIAIASDYGSVCNYILSLEGELISRRHYEGRESIMILWLGMENMMQEFSYYEKLPETKIQKVAEENREMQDIQDKIDNKFQMLFGEMISAHTDEKVRKQIDFPLYDATGKIVNLVKEGAKRGIFQYIFFSSVLSLKFVKDLKLDYFNYKMSGYLNKDNCYDFYNTTKIMNSMDVQDDNDSICLCYDGKKARFFLPYLVD